VWQELIGLPIAHCSHSSGSAPRTQHTACMHPAPHLTRLPAATHTQVRDHARTPITLPQHQSMPLPTTAPPHPHMKILRAPARSAPRRATPPPAAPRPPARPARRKRGRMDARGGRAGGWRLGAGGRGGEGGCTARGGLAAGQSDSHRAENREDAKERLPPPPPLISRRGCRAPAGSSAEKGRTPRAPEPRRARTTRLPSSMCAHENALSTSQATKPRQARGA
jgi:hypothetical protein